jgi:DNA-binding MarR family transcriptional regulator
MATADPEANVFHDLAEFRHQMRMFLVVSEQAAHAAGLQPQQHQLLLAVAGAPREVSPSIAYAAERLGLKHNTVVELADRCEQEKLLVRVQDAQDGRRVCLKVTAHGRKVLDRLSRAHLQELDTRGPKLIAALRRVLTSREHHAAAAGGH